MIISLLLSPYHCITIPEEGKNTKRRQYITPLAGAAQVPRNPVLMAAPALAPVSPVLRPAYAPVPVAAPMVRPVVAAAPALAPALAPAPVLMQQPAVVAPVVAPVGQCPGGPSLPIECDPKRPWPQCPPQSYCYATNSVDIGPYFCCPICEFFAISISSCCNCCTTKSQQAVLLNSIDNFRGSIFAFFVHLHLAARIEKSRLLVTALPVALLVCTCGRLAHRFDCCAALVKASEFASPLLHFTFSLFEGSTYGAAWRPATPFYNYVPPVPANWPDVARMTANWPAAAVAMPLKARKQQKGDEENEDEEKIGSAIDGWVERQAKLVSFRESEPVQYMFSVNETRKTKRSQEASTCLYKSATNTFYPLVIFIFMPPPISSIMNPLATQWDSIQWINKHFIPQPTVTRRLSGL